MIKKWLLTFFCLFHMLALSWWTLPHSFGGMVLSEAKPQTLEYKLFKQLDRLEKTGLPSVFEAYINLTGSQQYWDFFAPNSPRFHQYLSLCPAIAADPEQSNISCQDEPWFSNLPDDAAAFRLLGSDRSRLYRLTENLINLDDANLLTAFAEYYRSRKLTGTNNKAPAYLIAHQFELHPELAGLAKAGYREDKLLITLP